MVLVVLRIFTNTVLSIYQPTNITSKKLDIFAETSQKYYKIKKKLVNWSNLLKKATLFCFNVSKIVISYSC